MAPWRSCQHRDGEPYDTCISALVVNVVLGPDMSLSRIFRKPSDTGRPGARTFSSPVWCFSVLSSSPSGNRRPPFHQGSKNRDTQQLYAYSKSQRMLLWCCLCGDLARITHRITSVRRSDGHDSELNASRTSLPWKRWVPSWSSPTP